MSRKKEYFQKWKTNYDFKTFTNATVSTVITFVFALCGSSGPSISWMRLFLSLRCKAR